MSAISTLLASSGVTTGDPADEIGDGVGSFYLAAGRLVVSRSPARITTVLGSCLAMGLWDPIAGVGGMNHYMLPQDVGMNCETPRYARTAIRQLFAELVAAGADRRYLRAKLFGGACVMAAFQSGGMDLGSRNVEVARQSLEAVGIPIVCEDVGGTQGRKVVFRTDNGMTMVRKV